MADLETISVIIPTYNRAELLREALTSLLEQTRQVDEVVVVDDSSTDHTPEVVADLTREGLPVSLVQVQRGAPPGELRNIGVAASTGSVVAFLDSDDLWQPRRVQAQLEAWADRPKAGFAFCNLHRFDANGLFASGPYLSPQRTFNGRILGHVLRDAVTVSSTLMVSRYAFMKVGGFSHRRLGEDYALTLALAAQFDACFTPEPLVLMRAHDGNTARTQVRASLESYLEIMRSFLAVHKALSHDERRAARDGIANVRIKLARICLDQGDRRAGLTHVVSAAFHRGGDRRLLPLIARTLAPMPATRYARAGRQE
jgi:glycosyltransferase involved in cell wall biosynthesis